MSDDVCIHRAPGTCCPEPSCDHRKGEACERRGWPFHVAYYPPEGPNAPYYRAYIWPVLKCHTAKADTPAEALLAVYITAVRAGAKR